MTRLPDGRRRPTILLVEDVGWIREAMKRTAEARGYRVAEAAGAAEAVAVAERESPELILTEEELPTLADLFARLRAHARLSATPVVIVNPDAEERTTYGDAVVLNSVDQLACLLPRD